MMSLYFLELNPTFYVCVVMTVDSTESQCAVWN